MKPSTWITDKVPSNADTVLLRLNGVARPALCLGQYDVVCVVWVHQFVNHPGGVAGWLPLEEAAAILDRPASAIRRALAIKRKAAKKDNQVA